MFLKKSLSGGATLVAEYVPHVRSVSVGVWINFGSRDEPREFNGVSHFIEHLLFKGTGRRTAKDIATVIDRIGGYCDAFTSREYTCVYIQAMDSQLETIFDLLSDIVIHSSFDPVEFKREKDVIFEEIRMTADIPDDELFDIFFSSIYKNHPLGNPIQGTMSSVRKMDDVNIRKIFRKYYTPSLMTLSVAGNFDKKNLNELSEKYFGFDGKKPCRNPLKRQTPVFSSENILKNRKLEQAHLCVAFPGIKQKSKYRYAKYLLNLILGGTISSRLFQKVREERGLAYNIYSYYFSFEDTGITGIYAASNASNISEIIKLSIAECENIVAKGVGEEELSIAKENLKGNYMLSLESMNSRMIKLAKQEMFFGKFYGLDNILNEIDSVTSEDLQKLMKLMYKAEKLSAVVLGPVAGVLKKKDLMISR